MPQAASMGKASPMTQMNTRIERELKQRGDAVLARAGFSPSEAVRALWEFAAAHEREPQAVARALAVEDPEAERERQERIQRKRDTLAKARKDMANAMSRLGITDKGMRKVFETPDKELYEQALVERYRERGLL